MRKTFKREEVRQIIKYSYNEGWNAAIQKILEKFYDEPLSKEEK